MEKYSDPVSGSEVKKGDIITYYMKLSNTGEAEADAIIRDSIPDYTTYVSGSATSDSKKVTQTSAAINNKETLIWTVEALKPGESVIVSFQVKVSEMKSAGSRQIKNVAQIKQLKEGEDPLEAAKQEEGFTDTNEVVHKQEVKSQTKAGTKITGSTRLGSLKTRSVKTGDDTNVNWMFLLLAISMCFIIYIGCKYKTGKKNHHIKK